MISIHQFVFNPFSENTYILSNDEGECAIVDPGCYFEDEKQELLEYIKTNRLKPVKLLLTHAHLDHVFGNHFVYQQFGLKPELHPADAFILENSPTIAKMYGFNMEPSPEPLLTLEDKGIIHIGNDPLRMIHAPGHSPGSICFYSEEGAFLIGGDVLFRMSIGRTDLPGGDMNTLLNSIRNELFTLPGDTVVYSGHGPETDIATERRINPFLND